MFFRQREGFGIGAEGPPEDQEGLLVMRVGGAGRGSQIPFSGIDMALRCRASWGWSVGGPQDR